MDTRIATLLAQRLGLSAEQVGALGGQDPSALLATVGEMDPVLALLLSGLQLSEGEREPGPSTEEALAHARRTVHRLRRDLEAADVMLAHIAQIFGACSACWGMNARCARCGGTGGPGSEMPAREELLAWVQPALRRLGLRVVRAERPPSAL